MKCPYCGNEMQKGGTVAFGTTSVRWLPLTEYDAESYTHATSEGYDLGETVFPHGWGAKELVRLGTTHFCLDCYKAVGIFDINP